MHDYYAATEASRGVPPLDFDWDFYMQLWVNDNLTLITARENEDLLGFVMYIVMFHPQYKTVLFATCNTLAVKPERRGMGIASKLVRAAEPFLKMQGVKRVLHGARAVYDVEPLFPKLGFELHERYYSKVI